MTRGDLAVTWLYVPGTRPERFDKAMRSGADVVIFDLQDSVVPRRKDEARDNVHAYLLNGVAGVAGNAEIEVRVNAVGTRCGQADLDAFAAVPGIRAIRLPAVESPDQVRRAVDVLGGEHRVQCVIESAVGVERAFDIAASSPSVRGIGLGEADLSADLGIAYGSGFDWARGRIVVAARAAGLVPPAMSVFPAIDDDAGLAEHCAGGRRLGFRGCAAVHPRQLRVIRSAFAPSPDEVAAAHSVLAALAIGESDGSGAVRTEDGRMVDAAMRRRAEEVLALAGVSGSAASALPG